MSAGSAVLDRQVTVDIGDGVLRAYEFEAGQTVGTYLSAAGVSSAQASKETVAVEGSPVATDAVLTGPAAITVVERIANG